MSAWLMDPSLSLDERYEMMRDMAYIAVVFATGKRCDNLANLDPSDSTELTELEVLVILAIIRKAQLFRHAPFYHRVSIPKPCWRLNILSQL